MAVDVSSSGCEGVSVLAVTPLDEHGRLCDQDFVSLLQFVSRPMVEGVSIRSVTVCGEMGEGYCLSTADRSRVIRIARDVLGEEKTVIAAIFALSAREAVEQAEQCRESGADVVLVAPVATFPYATKVLEDFFRIVGAAAQLPVIAYLNKMFKQELPSAEMVKVVYDVPCVAGIKDSSGDPAFIARLLANRPAGKLMIHTVSSGALAGIQAGADGLMMGTSNLVPDAALETWVFGRREDVASQQRATAGQARLSRIAQLYKLVPESRDWVIVKEALRQMGVIRPQARFPASPYQALPEADQVRVREQVLLLFGASVPTQG
jgi:dihydrodipicolinate synthase/N-acetylneuraminate lyase